MEELCTQYLEWNRIKALASETVDSHFNRHFKCGFRQQSCWWIRWQWFFFFITFDYIYVTTASCPLSIQSRFRIPYHIPQLLYFFWSFFFFLHFFFLKILCHVLETGHSTNSLKIEGKVMEFLDILVEHFHDWFKTVLNIWTTLQAIFFKKWFFRWMLSIHLHFKMSSSAWKLKGWTGKEENGIVWKFNFASTYIAASCCHNASCSHQSVIRFL